MKTRWKILIVLGIFMVLSCAVSFVTMRIQPTSEVEVYKKLLRDRGEKLEISEVLPPPVSPEQNGAGVVRRSFALFTPSADDYSNLPPMMRMVAPGKAMIGWMQPDLNDGYFTDSWENATAAVVENRPATEMLWQAMNYPAVDFQMDYSNWPDSSKVLVEYLSPLKRCAQRLSAAAMCDLHIGDTATATTNLSALLALLQADANDRTLISQLVRIAMASIAASANWELMQSTNINDEELALLQRRWDRLEFIEPVENSLLMERAFVEATIPKMRSDQEEFSRYEGMGGSGGAGSTGDWLDGLKDAWQKTKFAYAASMWQTSWSYSDELHALQAEEIILEAMRAIKTNRVFNPTYTNMQERLSAIGITNEPDGWLMTMLDIPNFHRILSASSDSLSAVVGKTMAAEASKRIVITAIALKRFQLRHGNLPDELSKLSPEFLASIPIDPVDGKPLRYRRNADGTFLLYSIGEDGVDAGGNPTNAASGSSSFYWLRTRDWVWPQPATEAEVQKFYSDQKDKSE